MGNVMGVFPSNQSEELPSILTALPPMLASSSPALRASHFCKSLTYLNPLRRTSISGSKPLFHRTTSTISRNPLLSTQHTGLSGRTYTIEHVLQEEVSPPRQVYRASWVDTELSSCLPAYTPRADGHKFILKYIHPSRQL